MSTQSLVHDLSASWPIVGREDELLRVPDALLDSSARAVVIGGPAGVGKTRLIAEVASRATGAGAFVARVTATRSASSIPFGALAPLLPIDDLLADSIVGLLRRASTSIAKMGDGQPVVLAVDDAQLLDDASATLVHQLALDGAARLLLGIRHGEHIGPSLAGVVNDRSTLTITLDALRRRDVRRLVGHFLGGETDGALIETLWRASHGNPLYLREVLVASLEQNEITSEDGLWRQVEPLTMPSRLIELVESRLASVTDDARRVLEVLAVAGTVGRQALEDLGGTETVSDLVQRGLAVAARDARRQPVRLHHPLYEEAIRRRMSTRRLRATQLTLAGMIESAGMRRRQDRVLTTTLRLDAGGTLDLDLLEAAALDSYFSLDADLTERITRAAVAAGAGSGMRRLLAEIMRWQGRHEEAEAIVSAISPAGLDERERALTALVRAENLFRGLGEHDQAIRVLHDALLEVRQPAWRDELTALSAVFSALAGDVRSAYDAAAPIIDRGPSRAMAVASTAAVVALTFMGRPEDATVAAERAFEVATSLAPIESQPVVATHIMERVTGLVEAGRLDEAEMVARMSYEWSLASGHTIGQGWFALLLGRSAQTGGRLEEATHRYRESALAFRDLRDHGIRRWALAGLAQTTAALGRAAESSMALDELDTAPRTAVHLLDAEILRARAWLAIARRSHAEGRRLLLEAADWTASRGQHGLELAMLHDLVRMGDRAAASRASELAPELQGPLAAARGLHARAVSQQDAALLDEAGEHFAAIGCNLYAAEASAQAAAIHRRGGRSAAGAASEARADELAGRCDGAATPALSSNDEAQRLTPRELELATMAAAGRTSASIAAELGISIRTVNNLLQRAYVKLGVSGRRELAGRLDQH